MKTQQHNHIESVGPVGLSGWGPIRPLPLAPQSFKTSEMYRHNHSGRIDVCIVAFGHWRVSIFQTLRWVAANVWNLHSKLKALLSRGTASLDLWAGPGSCCLKETAAVTVHCFSKYRAYMWKALAFCLELIVPFWNLGPFRCICFVFCGPT